MRMTAAALAGLTFVVSAPCAARADPAPELVFALARDTLPAGAIRLTNGNPVKVSDWPALVFAEFETGAGPTASCTGVLVGPRALLTAGHCVTYFMMSTVKPSALQVGRDMLGLTCAPYDLYQGAAGEGDFALCFVAASNPTLSAMEFEVIEDERALAVGQRVWLAGYGCTDLRYDAIHQWTYTRAPHRLNFGADIVDSASSAMAQTRSERGREPMLCKGDSGGALWSTASINDTDLPRRIVGVNSFISAEARPDGDWDIISHMGQTGSAAFASWARKWSAEHGDAVICGITREPGDFPCRA
ncbi:MAG: trypsin-like serine protease [Hyphomonadaceae bacterium]|nr:trypsin-like serine protease [Hyphomonadaceae bacterium]